MRDENLASARFYCTDYVSSSSDTHTRKLGSKPTRHAHDATLQTSTIISTTLYLTYRLLSHRHSQHICAQFDTLTISAHNSNSAVRHTRDARSSCSDRQGSENQDGGRSDAVAVTTRRPLPSSGEDGRAATRCCCAYGHGDTLSTARLLQHLL